MKFLDLFTKIEKGNMGLTEESIYNSMHYDDEFIPLWGGNKEHNTIDRFVSKRGKTKNCTPITVFNGTGIIISLDGSAGSMTYKKNTSNFALNHHAGFFKIKNDISHKINSEYFCIFYAQLFKNMSSSKDSSKTLSLEQIYEINLDIPNYEHQNCVMDIIKPILTMQTKIIDYKQKLEKLSNRIFSGVYSSYQAKNIPIREILNDHNGNTGLTSEIIYKSIIIKGDRYEVLSSSTKNETRLGKIPKCMIGTKQLKTFEDDDGILVIRIGNNGKTFFLKAGKYAITDNAYILSLKKCDYEISLKWLMHELKNDFIDFASSDYGSWNKTGFLNNVQIDIPKIDAQLNVVTQYDKLENLINITENILLKINIILSNQIIYSTPSIITKSDKHH